MTLTNDFNDPIIAKRRKGTSSDPFNSLNETLGVINGKATLTEIPNRFEKVRVTGSASPLYEIEDGELQTNNFRVDYVEGVVFFHSSHNGENLTFNYLGEGRHFFPATGVYVTEESGDIQTAKEKFNRTDLDVLTQKTRVDQLIQSTPQPSEVVDMRVDRNGVSYPVAKSRMDAEQKKIEDAYAGKNGTNYTSLKDRFDKTDDRIGEIGTLLTTDKSSLVKSQNEMFTEIKNGRGTKTTLKERLDGIESDFTTLDQQIDTKAKEHWVDVSKFGYNLAAVKAAVATLTDGDTLYFPNALTSYQILGEAITIAVPNITITGSGLIIADYGFRPTESGFTADGLRMQAPSYSTNTRAISVAEPTDGKFIRNFNVRNCSFKNFFYAADFRGGSYDVTGNEAAEGFPVRDVVIENCYSETYTNQNAGHFNCIQVENISYLNNRTYGGQNATSYNAIKGNGFIKVIGNYDDNNSYGSCEIENASGKAVITGNTFKNNIWVDDSYSVVIDGNFVDDIIKVTVGSNVRNSDNIIISNNIAKAIRAESFGVYKGGAINNLLISDNTLNSNGTNTYAIWVDGKYTGFVLVDNNLISGAYNSGQIGIIRGTPWEENQSYTSSGQIVNANGKTYLSTTAGTTGTVAPSHTSGTATDGSITWQYINTTCEILLRQNIVRGNVVISGSGGLVYDDNNLRATYLGARDVLSYKTKGDEGASYTFTLFAGQSHDFIITYKSGLFESAPQLTYSLFNASIDDIYTTAHGIVANTKDAATIRIKNKGTTTTQSYTIYWRASEK